MLQSVPLRHRVFTASAWSLAGHCVSLAIRFGSNLIITRLLAPDMFGVAAIATIVMIGLEMFSDFGLRLSIVQSQRGNDVAFLNTAWVLQIIRGLVLWVAALIISLLIYYAGRVGMVPRESAYADPSLPWVIAVLALSIVISGFASTKLFEASRNLALARITQIDIAVQIVGVACMLMWAAYDRSIWALTVGGVVAAFLRTTLSHAWMVGNPNRWHWDSSAFVELIHFGKWVFASSILGFLIASGDRLLLGWLVDGTVLGIYVIAFSIYSAIEQVVGKITAGVVLPALSEVARSRRNLKAAYYRFHTVIATTAYFCGGVLMTSGETLVSVLYDQRYSEAGWMVQVLSVLLLAAPFQISTQCYLALGMPQLHSHILVARLVTLYSAVPIGFYHFGLPGALWGIVIGQLISLPIFIFYNAKNSLLDIRREFLLLPVIILGMSVGKSIALTIRNW